VSTISRLWNTGTPDITKPRQSKGKKKEAKELLRLTTEELEYRYLIARNKKQRRLDFSPEDRRKRDNLICLHYFALLLRIQIRLISLQPNSILWLRKNI
jgi:hypothetical protein